MASTVGHALCGISCVLAVIAVSPGRSIRFNLRSAALFAALANLPDIDFLVGYLVAADANALHQRATHSLIFAAVAGLLAGSVWRRPFGLWPASGVFAATILSHDAVDMLSGPALGFNPTPGIALFWPFNTAIISAPVTIFPGILHATAEELISGPNVLAVLYEIAVFAPIVAWLYHWQGKRHGNQSLRPG